MGIEGADADALDFVSRDRIVRLRAAMPDESPIDLDEHAAIIAYDVERRTYDRIKRREAYIAVTDEYVQDVRRFLRERWALRR